MFEEILNKFLRKSYLKYDVVLYNLTSISVAYSTMSLMKMDISCQYTGRVQKRNNYKCISYDDDVKDVGDRTDVSRPWIIFAVDSRIHDKTLWDDIELSRSIITLVTHILRSTLDSKKF